MKISLTQENLAKALNVVGRVVSSRASLPVLSNVLVSTDNKRLKLSATNLEIGINYWIGGSIEEEGAITVPAKLFSEFITALPPENIELSTNDQTLSVKSPHYQSQINGISAEEFPLIPQISGSPVLSIGAEELKDALQQVTVAASLDEARPVLAGVYLNFEGGELVAVATDSYRLAEKKLKVKDAKGGDKVEVIVPARTMQELIRVLGEIEGKVDIFVGEGQVMFASGDLQLTSRLIEGQFPNYKQIIPTADTTTFEIETSEFIRIAKVASLFARESAGSIRLEIKADGRVNIVSSASQIGENTSTAECEVNGDDGEISLNARYLLDALNVMEAEKLTFSISGKLNPCVLRPMSKDSEYLHLIMPLRT